MLGSLRLTFLQLVFISYNKFSLLLQPCPNKFVAVGSYCYYWTLGYFPYATSNRICASMKSSLATFKDKTEYSTFKQYLTNISYDHGNGHNFFINLYSFDGKSWTWLDDGSALAFDDFISPAAKTDFTYRCAICGFDSVGWQNSDCTYQRGGLVCQTRRADITIPQPCTEVYETVDPSSFHLYAANLVGANANGYALQTWGPFYALKFHIDGWTVPMYQMVSPTNTYVLAYDDTQETALSNAGYTLSRIPFYVPAIKLDQAQTVLYQLGKGSPPTDTLLSLQNTSKAYSMQQSLFMFATCPSTGIQSDCTYTEWTQWSTQCPVTCGGGQLTRTRTSVLPAFGQMCSSNVTVEYQTCNNYSCAELIDMLNKSGISTALADPASLSVTIQDTIPYMLSSMSDAEKLSMGFPLDLNLKTCTYNQQYCDMHKDVKTWYNPNLGACFTFNYGQDSMYTVDRAGEIYGLAILLYSSQDDYICSSTNAGFRFSIHDQSLHPFVENEGFDVHPGYINSVTINEISSILLSKPYGDCGFAEGNASTRDFYYTGQYTVEGCLKSCYQNRVIKNCGCGDPHYPLPQNTFYCNLTQKPCIDNMNQCTVNLSAADCNCPKECTQRTFPLTITKAKLLHSAFVLEYCSQQNDSLSDCMAYANKNFAILKVSFRSLLRVSYEEQPSYEVSLLLSDFSNVTGLLLGACVITVPEIILFFVLLCVEICCTVHKRVRTN